jgi:hypothetical protein
MALTPGDYWRAIQDGIRQRSFSAARGTLAMTRQADHNMRALGVHPDQPKPEPKAQRLWVPLSDERQKVPPFEQYARPNINEVFQTATAAMEGIAQAERPQAGQTRQAAATAFVQKMLDEERKIHDPRQKEMGLKQKQEEGQKPKRQVVQ